MNDRPCVSFSIFVVGYHFGFYFEFLRQRTQSEGFMVPKAGGIPVCPSPIAAIGVKNRPGCPHQSMAKFARDQIRCDRRIKSPGVSPGGGGGTPLYGLYRYVRPQWVWFFSRFGHK